MGESKIFMLYLIGIENSLKLQTREKRGDWLVGCFGFNGPLRQYFSLYRAVSQREGEKGEKAPKEREKNERKIDESKNVQTSPTRTFCKCSRPLPYCHSNCGRPGTGSLPSTIAPPDDPRNAEKICHKVHPHIFKAR